jgi:hypothetical protein
MTLSQIVVTILLALVKLNPVDSSIKVLEDTASHKGKQTL